MKRSFSVVIFTWLTLLPTGLFAQDDVAAVSDEGLGVKARLYGWGGLLSSRLASYKWFGETRESNLFNNTFAAIGVKGDVGSHIDFKFAIEGVYGFNTHPFASLAPFQPGRMESSVYPYEALVNFQLDEENLHVLSNDKFRADITAGLFIYKYNKDVRNLGEYLFRSGTYPGWLITNFDWAQAQLTGLKVSTVALNCWRNDLMLTTEMQMYPFYDLSFTWLTDLKIGNIIDIGGAVCLARFLPMNSNLTTPKEDQMNMPMNYWLENIERDSVTGSVTRADTAGFYTFQGTKLMARASIDLKQLLPASVRGVFSEADCKIYGELNVLGLENQGYYYDDVSERMPVTFGFNFPTFRLLDVLSIEAEHYSSPYPNSYGNQILFMKSRVGGSPTPYFGADNSASSGLRYAPEWGTPYTQSVGENWDVYTKDNWKWSVYAKRTIGKNFALIGQVARDHYRTISNSQTQRDYEEALTFTRNWYWAAKGVAYF